LAVFALGSCGSDENPVDPVVTDDFGTLPEVPKPTSLTSEPESDTVTVIEPLKGDFAPHVLKAKGDWKIKKQSCKETVWMDDCSGSWSTVEDVTDTWSSDLPKQYGYAPFGSGWEIQFMDKNTLLDSLEQYYHSKKDLDNHRCDCAGDWCAPVCCVSICWKNFKWYGTLPVLTDRPYLCRDRFWVVKKSQILPPGFQEEIKTTYTRGVEETECEEWAASVTVEGEATSPYGSLKTTIEASYSSSATKTVYEEVEFETTYTPEKIPQGNKAVYQVWVLVDRYTITDKYGKPYADPNYAFPRVRKVHVRQAGEWEAHEITYFPTSATVTVGETE
jgi:hypothetical protein